MPHEQREVPPHTSYETSDSRRLPERSAYGAQLSSAARPEFKRFLVTFARKQK